MKREEYVKTIQTAELLYTLFSAATKAPFVICDPKSFNDQIHMFVRKKDAEAFANEYREKKYLVTGVEVNKEMRLPFLARLVYYGINAVVLHVDEQQEAEVELKQIIQLKDPKTLPEKERPLLNPEFQLTGLYFFQELRRPEEVRSRETLMGMEEELYANVARASYLMPLEIQEENGQKKMSTPLLKNDKGVAMQPVFTDGSELQQFLKNHKMQVLKVPFEQLSNYLHKDAAGFVINPTGFSMTLLREQIKAIGERF